MLGDRIEEAKWILENYNYNRFAIGKDPITNCYYLFLTAQIRDNKAHTDRVLDELEKTYIRHRGFMASALYDHPDGSKVQESI